MAFIFIPMELFKIQGFFMRGAGGPAHYSIRGESKSHLRSLSWRKIRGVGCFVECEVVAYSAVNDVTTDTMLECI